MRKNRSSRLIAKKPLTAEQKLEMSLALHSSSRQEEKNQRKTRRRRSRIRAGLAVVAGRAAGAVSRRFHLGGGTSIMGLVAQRIYPEIVEHLATQLEHGSIIVTGTNGKTTTSSFLAAILSDAGLRVWQNREGSNLMRGIASSLVIRALPNGRLRRSGRAISVLEVDEATLPQVTSSITPRILIFNNLFRDQLDRYGEVDSVVAYWQRAIQKLPASTTLVLNADDPTTAALGENFPGKVLYYGIDDPTLDVLTHNTASLRHQVIDTRTCPHCGSDYTYSIRFYSHMGHYECTKCGLARPQPDIRVTHVQSDSFDRLRIQVLAGEQLHELVIPLPGLYNIYNALAAITAALALDADWAPIVTGIEQFKPVFGRGERIQAEGRTIRLLLAKNPTGFNEVLRTLFSNKAARHVLFVLNDNIADGRDISWIWDVDFERVVDNTELLAVTGTRALDLGLRLKYAGVAQDDMLLIPPAPLRAQRSEEMVNKSKYRINKRQRQSKEIEQATGPEAPKTHVYGLKHAMDAALSRTPVGETLFIVPTYTGLLEVHRELEQRGLTARYWEGNNA